MPNPLTLADAADLVDVAIQNIWLKGSEKETRIFEQYYNTDTTTDYYTKDSSLSGLGYAGRIAENATIVSQSPIQGYDQTFTQVNYGLVLPVTKIMWFFGIKKRNLTSITDELRKACSDMRERLCADRLDQGFGTSYEVTYDPNGNYSVTTTGGNGVALFSASQTREDGGTNNNNRITDGTTVNMDFEYDALKAAHRTAALIKDQRGKPMNISLDTLVVTKGYTNAFRAKEILRTLQKGNQPSTADREAGGVPDYKILELPPFTTNTDYWFMFDSTLKNQKYGLQYLESQPITLDGPNVVFRTEEIQYRATEMFSIGHNDYRGWVGSKNTNAA